MTIKKTVTADKTGVFYKINRQNGQKGQAGYSYFWTGQSLYAYKQKGMCL
jgi:hypothetical protein